MKATHKALAEDWASFLVRLRREDDVPVDLDYAEREKRRLRLEAHPLEWIKEFFPQEAKYEFADFQKRAIARILDHPGNWYEVLSWSRELAKSTVVMFVVLYMALTGRKCNIILCSNSKDNAADLLSVYRGQLENNERIKFYYGEQKGVKWEEAHFVTRGGISFKALGAGQSPRGKKNKTFRSDLLLLDDFDTDEECRNPDIINQKWNWFEDALYFTRSFSEPLTTVWCGNIIAKDCCIVRAGQKALELSARETPLGYWDVINIRMVNTRKPNPKDDFAYGTSVWPEKNSEEAIDDVLAQVSAASGQKECFNNPVTEGTYFKEIRWGKIPPLKHFPFLVSYGDPAPSNKVVNKKGVKKLGSFKANFLVGILDNILYVITGYLDHVKQEEFVNWYYYQREYVGDVPQIYNLIENNKLQDPFYEQVFIPLFAEMATKKGYMINISPDTRDKPDKFVRIEGNLEPLHRQGRMVFNIAEKENPHMKKLEEQFLLFDDGLPAPADGPDCIEGGWFFANQKQRQLVTGAITIGMRRANPKRL
ncbi:MAG: hypothetical protein LBS05_00090 [Tannerellaceae bacterium]|jgi:hypothetical protein|nr:hypothetical protein [Tannerellaceae bacterium]